MSGDGVPGSAWARGGGVCFHQWSPALPLWVEVLVVLGLTGFKV